MTTDMMPRDSQKTSPWVWVGLGCGGLVLLCVVAAVVVGLFLHGRFKNFEKQFDDPAVREQRVKEVLGTQEIPRGYHALLTFSLPWILDAAILTDRDFGKLPRGRSQAFDKWGFIYIRMPHKHKDKKMQEFLDGTRSPDELLQGQGMHFHLRDTVGRGTVQGEGGVAYRYLATRGEVQMREEIKEGITTLISVECPNDDKFRMAIWFGPDPTAKPAGGAAEPAPPAAGTPSGAGAGAAYAGTPADEAAIKEFMDHFALCRE